MVTLNSSAEHAGSRSFAKIALLILVVVLPTLVGVRLAHLPVFTYRPGPSGFWRPLHAKPEQGPSSSFGGPFYRLQPGSYRAAFRLRNDAAAAGLPLCRLQVAVWAVSGMILAARDVPVTACTSYREEEIRFTVPEATVVETQAWYSGRAGLSIDGVRVWHEAQAKTRFRLGSICAALAGLAVLIAAFRFRCVPQLRTFDRAASALALTGFVPL